MISEEKITTEFTQFSNGKIMINNIEITSIEDWNKVTRSIVELQQENQQLKIQISAREEVANKLQSTLQEIRKIINQPFPSYSSCIKAIDEIEYIIDKNN